MKFGANFNPVRLEHSAKFYAPDKLIFCYTTRMYMREGAVNYYLYVYSFTQLLA